MNKKQLLELIYYLNEMKEDVCFDDCSVKTLYCLVQMKSNQDISTLLNSLGSFCEGWQIDFRNSKVFLKTEHEHVVIRFEKLIQDKDYYSICGSSFSVVVMDVHNTRNYVLSRLRLWPQKVLVYDDNALVEATKQYIELGVNSARVY